MIIISGKFIYISFLNLIQITEKFKKFFSFVYIVSVELLVIM